MRRKKKRKIGSRNNVMAPPTTKKRGQARQQRKKKQKKKEEREKGRFVRNGIPDLSSFSFLFWMDGVIGSGSDSQDCLYWLVETYLLTVVTAWEEFSLDACCYRTPPSSSIQTAYTYMRYVLMQGVCGDGGGGASCSLSSSSSSSIQTDRQTDRDRYHSTGKMRLLPATARH